MKVGVLLPQSKVYPLLAKNFLNGLRLALDQNPESKVEILFEDILTAGHEQLILAKLQKLMLQDDVDVNVVFTDSNTLADIKNQALAYNKPLLVNNIGAKLPFRHSVEKGLFINSLELWKSTYLLGVWAAKNTKGKVAVATYFYESGYDLSHAFLKGFTSYGGEIELQYIAPLNPAENDYEILMERVSQTNADFIFAAYSGIDAINFLNKYNTLGSNLPVYAVNTMFYNYILKEVHAVPKGITTCGTWFEQDGYAFGDEYRKRYHAEPDCFSKLGYESGDLLRRASDTITSGENNHHDLTQIMTELKFLIDQRRVSNGENQRVVEVLDKNGAIEFTDKGIISDPDGLKRFEQDKSVILGSGWKQPYLVT